MEKKDVIVVCQSLVGCGIVALMLFMLLSFSFRLGYSYDDEDIVAPNHLHTTSRSEAGVFDSNERSEWPTWKRALHKCLRSFSTIQHLSFSIHNSSSTTSQMHRRHQNHQLRHHRQSHRLLHRLHDRHYSSITSKSLIEDA